MAAAGQVSREDADDHTVARFVGRYAVDRSEVLLDVHRQPFPYGGIFRICPESHRRRRRAVERRRHDRHRGAALHGQRRDVGQLGRVARNDDDAPQQRLQLHVRSVHVPA